MCHFLIYSTAASVRTIRSRTIASAPVFRVTERAEKRKEVFLCIVSNDFIFSKTMLVCRVIICSLQILNLVARVNIVDFRIEVMHNHIETFLSVVLPEVGGEASGFRS